MAPPPLPLFSPSPKQPPPPPWLHGPKFPAALNPIEAPPKPQKNDLPNPQTKNNSSSTNPLAAGVPGGRTRRAVLGIIRRVRSLELSDPPNTKPRPNSSNSTTIPSFNLFPVDRPQQGDRQEEEETGRNEKGRPASSSRALPWSAARDEDLKVALRREKKVREPTVAERLLEPAELDRLRWAARGMDTWVRAKKAGVTDEVVEDVRKEWSSGRELAAVRVIEPLRRCMDRAREILETKS